MRISMLFVRYFGNILVFLPIENEKNLKNSK